MSNAPAWKRMRKPGTLCFLLLVHVYGFPFSTTRRQCSVAVPENHHHGPLLSQLWSSRNNFDTSARTWNQGAGVRPTSFASTTATQSTPKQSRPRRKTKPMPVTGYDFKAIEELYDRRPLDVGWRLNSLGFPLLGRYCKLAWSFGLCKASSLAHRWLAIVRLVHLPIDG
jgi:hypothetical protein